MGWRANLGQPYAIVDFIPQSGTKNLATGMSTGKQINYTFILGGGGYISLDGAVNVWSGSADQACRWGKVKPPLPTEQNNRGEGEDGFIGSISVNN
jgi:hypothetical protein